MNCPRLLSPPEHQSFRSTLATPPCPHWHRAPLPDSSTRNTPPPARASRARAPVRQSVPFAPPHPPQPIAPLSCPRFLLQPATIQYRSTHARSVQPVVSDRPLQHRRASAAARAHLKRFHRRGSSAREPFACAVRLADSHHRCIRSRRTNLQANAGANARTKIDALRQMISLRELKPMRETRRRTQHDGRVRRFFDGDDGCDRAAWVCTSSPTPPSSQVSNG